MTMKLTPRQRVAIVLALIAIIIAACVYKYQAAAQRPTAKWVVNYRADTGRRVTLLVSAETPERALSQIRDADEVFAVRRRDYIDCEVMPK
jgi:hypothetical protein